MEPPLVCAKTKGTTVELQPLTLHFKMGEKTYEITSIQQRIGGESGEWQNIDLTYFTQMEGLSPAEKNKRGQELAAFINAAKKTINVMQGLVDKPAELDSPHSFTLHFQKKYDGGPSLLQSTLGHIFERFRYKPEATVLQTISYKETESASERTFEVKLDQYDEISRQRILDDTLEFNLWIKNLVIKTQEKTKPLQLKTPKEEPQRENTIPAPIGDINNSNNDPIYQASRPSSIIEPED